MAQRGTYRTKQRELLRACLHEHDDAYLSIDELWAQVTETGADIGRTTVYRNLESMVKAGEAWKTVGPGGEARYRIAPEQASGQLVCLRCEKAFPLDCTMLDEFAAHVNEHHGFAIEGARTVLYGTCANCSNEADEADKSS